MNYKTKVFSNKVLIRKDEPKEKTDGGLYLPEAMKLELNQPIQTGTVVATGPGLTRLDGVFFPIEVKKGQRILFEKNHLVDAKELGEPGLAFISEDKIMAVIDEE